MANKTYSAKEIQAIQAQAAQDAIDIQLAKQQEVDDRRRETELLATEKQEKQMALGNYKKAIANATEDANTTLAVHTSDEAASAIATMVSHQNTRFLKEAKAQVENAAAKRRGVITNNILGDLVIPDEFL